MPLVKDLVKEPEKLTAGDLIKILTPLSRDTEVRIGDVSVKSDLHGAVEAVDLRSQLVIISPRDDDFSWKDEHLASEVSGETLWPEQEEED